MTPTLNAALYNDALINTSVGHLHFPHTKRRKKNWKCAERWRAMGRASLQEWKQCGDEDLGPLGGPALRPPQFHHDALGATTGWSGLVGSPDATFHCGPSYSHLLVAAFTAFSSLTSRFLFLPRPREIGWSCLAQDAYSFFLASEAV